MKNSTLFVFCSHSLVSCHVVRLSLLPFTVFYNHRDAVSSYTRIQQQTPFMIFSIALYFVQVSVFFYNNTYSAKYTLTRLYTAGLFSVGTLRRCWFDYCLLSQHRAASLLQYLLFQGVPISHLPWIPLHGCTTGVLVDLCDWHNVTKDTRRHVEASGVRNFARNFLSCVVVLFSMAQADSHLAAHEREEQSSVISL